MAQDVTQQDSSAQTSSLGGAPNVAALAFIAFGCLGALFILDVAGWRFTAPLFFMWMGWASVLATGLLLWRTAWAADKENLETETLDEAKRRELLAEKKILLRSIKNIEFDRDLGKVSDADVDLLTALYKQRAVEIIKILDEESQAPLSMKDQIERDVAARKKLQASATLKRARLVASAKKGPSGKRKGSLGAAMPETGSGTTPGDSRTGSTGGPSTTARRRFASDMLEEASADDGGAWEPSEDTESKK